VAVVEIRAAVVQSGITEFPATANAATLGDTHSSQLGDLSVPNSIDNTGKSSEVDTIRPPLNEPFTQF
jgi:hypothetical protein